eukprot:GFYU01001958.1.p1 GENE.GFYU01001958.1~~GFYU01001958.1.p1  ORF type:complete len:719 (-),score=245.26 GFYU01001958.1:159-2315(-)
MKAPILLTLALAPALGANALCPYLASNGGAEPSLPEAHPPVPGLRHSNILSDGDLDAALPQKAPEGYEEAARNLDWDAVKADIHKLFKDSKDFWPADYGNYAPFFIRLAWHNAGSYRISDGRGGADGGRQRFDPERSWEDNTNLDKARKLLEPIKVKYGLGLSWGDLIVLTGTEAIKSMGGPDAHFCGGRVDADNGDESQLLGPNAEQQEFAPCPVNGQCESPLGSTTVGLIYVNPEGPMGQPIPEKSAGEVRDTFGRMAMNDTETVALIGGGHAFGKTHGACPAGAGPAPKDDPENPWPGKCGTGKGKDAFTSGFEGPWTTDPTTFDNSYYKTLVDYKWKVVKGPGGHYQWHVADGEHPLVAPGAFGGKQDVMMLTSDMSLKFDPEGSYQKIIKEFAQNQEEFANHFGHAWYKLMSRDMGPVTRCVGPDVPPAREFQYPLPPTPSKLADFNAVADDVRGAIKSEGDNGAFFVRLAWQCASTYRQTDYLGGCNGARIRFSPQKDWPVNAALDQALNKLAPVKEKYGDTLSWADLIVLAGTVAVEDAAGVEMSFCGGRTDAQDGEGSTYLKPELSGDFTDKSSALRRSINLLGLTKREYVALSGGHSLGKMHVDRSGYSGAWTTNPSKLDNEYFKLLLSEEWEPHHVPDSSKVQYKAAGKDLYMLKTDLMLTWDAELLAIVQDYAGDNELFTKEFSAAWTKLMNADRFDGPTGNVCNKA